MRLPGNSLGVSDAEQFHLCPKKFFRSMLRHTREEGAPDHELIAHHSEILCFGSCVHDAALLVARNPEIYLDDAVDHAWRIWSPYLQPHHHAELRQDVQVIIDRSLEAVDTLDLVTAEEDWKVPVFVGRADGGLDEEEGEWYYYRFKIDALYRRKDDPSHYVIRDFKTTRRRRWQDDIDSDMQFTAYDFGVREALGEEVQKVTIWYDQVKHGEVFSSRDQHDRIAFQEYIESTIKAVLDAPTEEVMDTYKLNQWCGWCPLLEGCGVVDHANDLALIEIAAMKGDMDDAPDIKPYIERYERSKLAVKALEEYNSRMSGWLKNNLGTHGNKTYTQSTVETPKWRASDLVDIVGEGVLDKLPLVSKTTIKDYLADPDLSEALMSIRKKAGYERLNAKDVKDDDT